MQAPAHWLRRAQPEEVSNAPLYQHRAEPSKSGGCCRCRHWPPGWKQAQPILSRSNQQHSKDVRRQRQRQRQVGSQNCAGLGAWCGVQPEASLHGQLRRPQRRAPALPLHPGTPAPDPWLPSAQPEMSRNVQKYGKDVYLRASEAQQCRVHSTLVIPLFADAARSAAVGALEVVQTCDDMPFSAVVKALAAVLEVRSAPAPAAAGVAEGPLMCQEVHCTSVCVVVARLDSNRNLSAN